MAEPQTLLTGLTFSEGPRWHDGALYFSDMHAGQVVRVDLAGERKTVVEHSSPSGLGFLPDGTLLVVAMEDRKVMRLESGRLVEHADLSGHTQSLCNDMVVDGKGRAYVGNFGFDLHGGGTPAPTCLVLVQSDGSTRVVADELMFPNGMVITPDGLTLIVAETFGGRLTAFNIEADGTLSGRRLWAQLQVAPDGLCLDADNCVWVANPVAPGGFVRVAEGGEVSRSVELEQGAGYACALGGPDRTTLFLLEADESHPDKTHPGGSRIRTLDVDVPGAGLP